MGAALKAKCDALELAFRYLLINISHLGYISGEQKTYAWVEQQPPIDEDGETIISNAIAAIEER